ncbi:MAG: ribbon-helix-helix protein, CopG family [Nitrospiraceae bacterium]|nr:MAG: ribbon-helix-helix protein, CopG family [Nitrospiraceae bacterium]
MVRTQIQLTEEQAKAVREVAKSRHLSVAELIRQAIDMVIISNKFVDINELRKRAET